MHEAYEINPLLKLNVQIDSITAYDETLLVGTRQGHLLMYHVTPRPNDQKFDVELMKYNKTFSKKPIVQLDVVPEYNLLISLTDNIVSVYDITTLNYAVPTKREIARTKGATLFTIHKKVEKSLTNKVSILLRMCVVVKRKLQFYYWKNTEFLKLIDDISLNDIPKTITWCQEVVCVGFRGEYTLFEINDEQKSKELFPTTSEPCIVNIINNTFLLGKEKQSIFVNTKGDAENTSSLKWTDVPSAMAWDEPYVLGLLADSIEVQTIDPCGSIQIINDVPKARLICFCKRGLLYIASVSQLWCLQSVDITKQRQHLLNNKQFRLALNLTSISDETEEDKKDKIHQIQTLYAYDLFANKNFRQSMDEFLKLETDPYNVIRLFPDLLPQQNEPEASNAVPKLQDRDLEEGISALIEYLTAVRLKTFVDTQTKATANASGNLNERNAISKATQQLLQIIDTTLLKCYLQTNDALVAPLLRRDYCHLGEAEKTLKKHHKYSELIILYQTKGQHKKALELLQKQANQMDSSMRGHDRSIQYLQHLGAEHINLIFEFADWILNVNPEEGLKIFTDDIIEVENLPRPKVLDYLLRTHNSLVIPYLEHVVHTWGDTNPLFHNALIHQYRVGIEQKDNESAAIQHLRNKLVQFLETSTRYTPESVIQYLPPDSLFEEHAIILGKLNRHEEVLTIYLGLLGDIKLAIDYCHKVFCQNGPNTNEVYVILIKMLLFPSLNSLMTTRIDINQVKHHPSTEQRDLETALQILEQYADRIDPIKALAVLPDDVSIARIHHFLETSLHQILKRRRKAELLRGLLYAEHLQVQELRLMHESQSILITELNVCPVCKKRFGNQSAFVRYPNGDVVHFSCQDKRM